MDRAVATPSMNRGNDKNPSWELKECRDDGDVSDANEAITVDRISNLPEAIICHILSFLPTEEVVATSFLSKSWKSHWTKVTNLHFDDVLWQNSIGDRPTKPGEGFPVMNFIGFVNMVLINQSTEISLNKFHLKMINHNFPSIYLNIWVNCAITRNVRNLSLDMSPFSVDDGYYPEHEYHLPGALYTCRTLEALHLSGPFLLQDPTAVSLPKLEVLRLNFVQYGSDESVRKLVSGSPSLHTLWIHRYHYDGMAVCTISSPVLKYLDYSHGMCYGNNFHDVSHFKLVIDAPALGYLTLVNFSCDEISLMQKLTSLREVRLQTSPFMPCLEGEVAVGLVKAFGSSAEFMKLSYETMEALFSCTTTTKLSATFERLTVLDVQVDCFGLGDLMELIDCCPVLEVLQVQMLECVDPNIWRNPSSVPKCLLSSLKQVVYLGFEYHMDETSMLGFTVKHALVLETVDIICKTFLHLSGTITSFRKMLMSRRVSPTCRIDIS